MLHYLNNAMHRAEQKLLQDEKPTPWSLADEFSKFKMLFEGQDESEVMHKFSEWLVNKSQLTAEKFKEEMSPSVRVDDLNVNQYCKQESFSKYLSFGQPSKPQVTAKREEAVLPVKKSEPPPHAFIQQIMQNELHCEKTRDQLNAAVKNFETQFATGKLEAVVYNHELQKNQLEQEIFDECSSIDEDDERDTFKAGPIVRQQPFQSNPGLENLKRTFLGQFDQGPKQDSDSSLSAGEVM